MKRTAFLMILMCSCLLIAGGFRKNELTKKKIEPVARWTGTLKRVEKIIHSNGLYVGTVEKHAEVFFTAALPTMLREDENEADQQFTDDKGTGNFTVYGELTNLLNKQKCISDCKGNGKAELHTVIVREWDNTYDIEAIAPSCYGTKSSCDGNNTTISYEEEMMIGVSNEKFTDKDVLTGTKTVTSEMPGGLGTVTATTTWHLTRVKEDDVELIVTPVDYDKWLPVPGKDEVTRGAVMTVNLKLQGKNGKPLKAKAESFELRLNNTSIEPGITINYPVEPDPKQLPDLRFLLHPSIESLDPDQFVSVGSPDGVTGKAMIASYDGGGWSILTAEAILKDGRKIQGRLLKPGGEIDIRIPKRDPNSHIGEAWLKANGNPGETDDIESKTGNKNIGDGLSAYEEYRGVISEAEFGKKNPNKFGRLDPQIKELGVKVDKAETQLFLLGIKWLENASGLNVILFNETEIPPYRRINENAITSQVYKQYVLNLYKGPLGHENAMGMVFTTGKVPDIPANTYAVVIDIDAIKGEYNNIANVEKPTTLPFTLAELAANVVAHELGHGVAAWHHGRKPNLKSPIHVEPGPPFSVQQYDGKKWNLVNPIPSVRIFNRSSAQISLPYTIQGLIGQEGNSESGDLDCIMAYVPYCRWARIIGADGAWIFNEVPLLDVGRKMCASKMGTKINHSLIYFGHAEKGNCLSQIKLK